MTDERDTSIFDFGPRPARRWAIDPWGIPVLVLLSEQLPPGWKWRDPDEPQPPAWPQAA